MDGKLKGVLIQGLDTLDIIGFMEDKKNKFLAISLTDLEEIIPPDPMTRERPEEFYLIRKLILDLLNNYNRSVIRVILGPVEGIE